MFHTPFTPSSLWPTTTDRGRCAACVVAADGRCSRHDQRFIVQQGAAMPDSIFWRHCNREWRKRPWSQDDPAGDAGPKRVTRRPVSNRRARRTKPAPARNALASLPGHEGRPGNPHVDTRCPVAFQAGRFSSASLRERRWSRTKGATIRSLLYSNVHRCLRCVHNHFCSSLTRQVDNHTLRGTNSSLRASVVGKVDFARLQQDINRDELQRLNISLACSLYSS